MQVLTDVGPRQVREHVAIRLAHDVIPPVGSQSEPWPCGTCTDTCGLPHFRTQQLDRLPDTRAFWLVTGLQGALDRLKTRVPPAHAWEHFFYIQLPEPDISLSLSTPPPLCHTLLQGCVCVARPRDNVRDILHLKCGHVCICGFHSSKANLNQRHNMWKNDCCKNVGKNVERMGRDFWQGNKGTQAGHALAQVLKKSLQMDFEN